MIKMFLDFGFEIAILSKMLVECLFKASDRRWTVKYKYLQERE